MRRVALALVGVVIAGLLVVACGAQSANVTPAPTPTPGFSFLLVGSSASAVVGHTASVRVHQGKNVVWCSSSAALTGQSVFTIGPSPEVLTSDGNFSVEWFIDGATPASTTYTSSSDPSWTTELFHVVSSQTVFFDVTVTPKQPITWTNATNCPGI